MLSQLNYLTVDAFIVSFMIKNAKIFKKMFDLYF